MSFSAIRRFTPIGFGRPPHCTPNWGSPQATGLIGWYVSQHNALVEVTRAGTRALSPIAAAGAIDPANLVAPAGQVGMGAKSIIGGHAWDTGLPGVLNGLTAVTIAYWIYPIDVTSSNSCSLWGQSDGTASSFCETSVFGTNTTGPYWRGGTDHRNAFTERLTANGTLQHMAWVADASTTTQYYNGVNAESHAGGCGTIGTAATYGLWIGGQNSGSGGLAFACTAVFVDFRVYNRALSDSEIWSLYSPSTRWSMYLAPRTYRIDVPAAAGGGGGGKAIPIFHRSARSFRRSF